MQIIFPRANDIQSFTELWDLHSHTNYMDGSNSVKEMIDAAENLGLTMFAITEHVRTSSLSWWNFYVEDIALSSRLKSLTTIIGIEANAIGHFGNVDVPDEIWEKTQLALGAVHGYYSDSTWNKIPDGMLSKTEACDYEINKAVGLCHNPKIDILAHPGWLFEKNYGIMPDYAIRQIVREAKQTNTAVEINLVYLKNPLRFLEILMEENPLVSFGSNAHSKEQLNCMVPTVKQLISGLSKEGVK